MKFHKLLIILNVILLASCSSYYDSFADEDGAMESRGLGRHGRIQSQEEGESYTAQAPHNQVYLFDFDSNNIAAKYLPSIKAQAHYLKSHPNARILLAGHTDERGSREYNVALGERRANAVASLITLTGVPRKQLRIVSYGKERPVYTAKNQESYKQNRRVELTYEITR